MKIIALEAENVKCLKAVRIKPDGSPLVVIGGENEAGKSAVLDSIQYGLGGASSIPSKPIREGQKKANIVLDLGDIKVARSLTKKGTNLVVKNKKGVVFSSPQAMLDKLRGDLAFDPEEFSRMDDRKQSEILKKLLGLCFDDVDAKGKKLFAERTEVNRRGKELKANIDSMTEHEGVPDNEVSVRELSDKCTKALEHNQKIATAQKELEITLDELDREEDRIITMTEELAKAKNHAIELKKTIDQNGVAIEKMELIDTEAINLKISSAEDINRKVRENKSYTKIDEELTELRKQSKSLTNQIDKIEEEKTSALANAKFPIDGLGLGEDGVIFEGIPFNQCSQAQRIRVSVAMGLAMNPELKILLIREGSLLDSKNLAMIAEMAEKADAQIWIERVGKGSECSIIIEDGEIKE